MAAEKEVEAEVEAEATAVEQPPTTEEAEPVKKEKKPRTPKQPKAASHPPYFQMIKEALSALKEKSGSSPYAIAKYMEGKHKAVLPANFRKILGLQLKNFVNRGKLIKIKASYKLSEAGKEEKKKAPQRKTTRKTKTTKKKPEAAKKAKKSAATAKPKQPKSIKSPAAKRTRKASAV